MKKILLAAITLAGALIAQAQIADVGVPQPLLKGVESDMYNPVLSADGSKLLFSDIDYSNLRVYDFNDNVTEKVPARGYSIYNHFAKVKVAVNTGGAVRTEGSKLIITDSNGVEKSFTPIECTAGYCWASLSPDGKKVVFLAAGKGLVVTDLNGNILAQPGNYESPAWFGNDHLLVQHATDDGHQLRSSQILLINLDGSAVQPLTKPESMTMTPTGSAEAGKVVFSTIDGRLYQQTVKLK